MSTTWQSRLRDKGYRLTPQRELVLDAITALGHATPDEIATEVKRSASGVNISTVYRNLELLEELGLVTHTHLGHGAPTYHPASSEDHVHLVCRRCGTVTEVGPEVVQSTVTAVEVSHGFEADLTHFAIFGTCATCREAQ